MKDVEIFKRNGITIVKAISENAKAAMSRNFIGDEHQYGFDHPGHTPEVVAALLEEIYEFTFEITEE